MALKPEHAKLSAYFNSDNGTGRVRGIWLQGNTGGARRYSRQWMAPLRGPRRRRARAAVGRLRPTTCRSTPSACPGFQFMVDRLEYNSRTHHSNMDVFDRVQRDDLVQQATVIAVFAYNAAMRDEKLPRKPLPSATTRSSPLNHDAVELARKRSRYPASSRDKMPAR